MDFDDLEEEEGRCGVEYESFSDQVPEVKERKRKEEAEARQREKEALEAARQEANIRAQERYRRQQEFLRQADEDRLKASLQELKERSLKAEAEWKRVEKVLAGIPEKIGDAPKAKSLSVREALDLEEELIAEFRRPEFQASLHAAWFAAGDSLEQKLQARQAVCLPVQIPVVERYGFEPSRRGVALSVQAYAPLMKHPEVARKSRTVELLVDPDRQREAPQLGEEDVLGFARHLDENGWVHMPKLGVAQSVLDGAQWEIHRAKAELMPGQGIGGELSYRTDKRVFLDLRPGVGRKDLPSLGRLVEILVDFVGRVSRALNATSDGPRLEVGGHCSPMLARYATGQRYIPHVDNGGNDGRVLTLVYYLNRGWQEAWGGSLRLYPGAPRSAIMKAGSVADLDSVAVVPEEDAAVLFRADHLLHEVEATERDGAERFALTLWFNGECFYGPFLPLDTVEDC